MSGRGAERRERARTEAKERKNAKSASACAFSVTGSGASTGKYVAKKDAGQPISARISTMTWKMMSSRFTTAQKTPAGWLGTVLPL